jgi:glycosyltransferase involved in cell wall biosynthesis
LVRAGHGVSLVSVLREDELHGTALPRAARVEGRECRLVALTESALRDGPDAVARSGGAADHDAVVGVSALGAASAVRLAGALPVWADVFGDLMAEAQAKAAGYGNDPVLLRFWGLLHGVLDRADRFSAVSAAGADALIGQLGMTGRLSRETLGEDLVHVIPCAAEADAPADADAVAALRRRCGGDDAFVLAWNGSFNTWCDVDTLFSAVDRAMEQNAGIVFLATGGAVTGHDELTYRRFRGLVAASAFRDRYFLDGWIDARMLPVYYAAADVALNVEKPIYERRLGSENRVANWLAAGLPVITTAGSELGRALVDARAGLRVASGDVDGLSSALLRLRADPEALAAMSRCARLFAVENLDFSKTAEPLLAWTASPRRSGDAATRRLLRVGLVSQPQTMVDLLEAYLAELGLWEIARRSVRWLWRRLRAG